jgi:hypothetical protein
MMKHVVILAHAGDAGARMVALWLASELGSQTVRIVRPEVLSLAKWSLRVDCHGAASTSIEWPQKEPLEGSSIGAVFNRIRHLPVPRFRRACAKDRDYADAEFHAVVTGWLARYGERVVQGVRRDPLLTPMLPLQHWATAAAACGLPVAARTVTNQAEEVVAGTVLVAGSQVGGIFADRFGRRCLATAQALRLSLLEFRFAIAGSDVVLAEVDPLPPLDEPWAAALTGQLLASVAAGRPH